MRYRVKEEYRDYDMAYGDKASAIDLDVNKPIVPLSKYDDKENAGGNHIIKYYDKNKGWTLGGFMDIDMLEEWE